MLFTSRGSPTTSSRVMRGFRDEYGSWKIICMLGRRLLSALPFSLVISTQPEVRSLNQTSPVVGSKARKISRLVVVLPQPDSPTNPSVLPLGMVKLTPSTARTWPTTRLKKPCVIGKSFFRSRTSSRFASSCGAVIGLLPTASLRSLLGEGQTHKVGNNHAPSCD